MSSVINAVLSMKMDIYRQLDVQDVNTGALRKSWTYYKTIDCHAKGVISNSATTRSSDKQVFSNKYQNDQMIQVRTSDRLTAREKVTNIRNAEGICIWTEINFPTETPTVFEVVGTTPITDPFGRVVGYNTAMKRSENQEIGL
jgi:hypothetical protein